MEQSKTVSLIETCVNVGTGFLVSLVVWYVIVIPVWEFELTHTQNLSITLVFTFFAIVRSYIIRRFFATKIHNMAVKLTKGDQS